MSPKAENSAAAPAGKGTAPPRAGRFALWLSTGFGLGYLPAAPGTWGSLAGVALHAAIPLLCLPPLTRFVPDAPEGAGAQALAMATCAARALLTLGVSAAGVWAAGRAERHFARRDPPQVVVDEISGQLLALLPLGPVKFAAGWKYLLLGFILFRVFDIWKPFPIRRAEKLRGGWGIMADDWIAGVYTAILLWAALWLELFGAVTI
jgi:phosphatidylglycerophosphatase A